MANKITLGDAPIGAVVEIHEPAPFPNKIGVIVGVKPSKLGLKVLVREEGKQKLSRFFMDRTCTLLGGS